MKMQSFVVLLILGLASSMAYSHHPFYYHPYGPEVMDYPFVLQKLTRDNLEELGRRKEPIDGAFLIPAKVNGAFVGPLAVVPGNPVAGHFISNSVGSPATQYLPIIDGPNWPFIKPATNTNGRSPLGLSNSADDTNKETFLADHHPNDYYNPFVYGPVWYPYY